VAVFRVSVGSNCEDRLCVRWQRPGSRNPISTIAF
jgi:hypothetical protein